MPVSRTLVPTTIYLIRNGQASQVTDQLNQPVYDPELDEQGRIQSRCLADIFQKRGLTRLISAPSLRTQQTATYISRATGVSIETDYALCDRDYGPWCKLPRKRVDSLFGGIDNAPDIEDYESFSQRVSDAIRHIACTSNHGESIVIISHKSVNRAILSDFFPDCFKSYKDVSQNYACWNLIEYIPLHRWNLLAVNFAVPRAQQTLFDTSRLQIENAKVSSRGL